MKKYIISIKETGFSKGVDFMLFKSVNLKRNEGYYFPLFNKHLKASITPNLLGDLKKDYNSYFLKPVSEVDLFESYGRHVLLYIDGKTYTLSGKGHLQQKMK